MRSDVFGRICLDAVRNRHLLIALSGGADSVALAHFLSKKRREYGLTLTAVHFNHHIRGPEADGDAAFCRELCRRLELALIEGEGDVPALAAERGVGLETAARDARYRFLYEAMERCGAELLVTAHHMDDQAETVLMHLLRGTGPEGISGMEIISGRLYRPLLGVRKSALRDYLRSQGISWREDASNAADDTVRNALRLNVLPEIEKSYPSAAEALARYAALARLESDYLGRLAEKFAGERVRRLAIGWRISLAGEVEEVLLRRTLRKICGSGLMYDKTEELLALCGKRRGKTEISALLFAEKTPDALYILQKDVQIPGETKLKLCGKTKLGEICMISAEPVPIGSRRNTMNEEILDGDCLEGACIRTRRDGDRIRPLGAGGDRLLSDYFTDRKIDRPLRDLVPLAARGGRILWVGGLGIAEEAKLRSDSRRAIKLTYITDEKAEV